MVAHIIDTPDITMNINQFIGCQQQMLVVVEQVEVFLRCVAVVVTTGTAV
jgi:hypothetical protein